MARKTQTDNLYRDYQKNTQAFQFDQQVVDVFPDMIKRSVPGYDNIIEMIGVFTQCHAQDNSYCYDLGCSLGASTLSIIKNLGKHNCKVIGVDNSQSMTTQCKKNLSGLEISSNYDIICDDLLNIKFKPSSVIVLNFTLQFIALEDRDKLLSSIYSALIPGGIFILSEKLNFNDDTLNHFYTDVHHAFKKSQGYSDLEISQKRNALENVLLPETKETHINRLKQAGFDDVKCWFQCLNFSSFAAIK